MCNLDKLGSKNILVIGDVMLDAYYSGEIERISPEAPVPVFLKKSERYVAGGAANVAVNLAAAGQIVSILTVIGKDDNGQILRKIFRENNINTELIAEVDRGTTTKTRFLASNNQQVMRLDMEDTTPFTSEETGKMLKSMTDRIREYDLVLLSDYMKGLLSKEFTQEIISATLGESIPVIVDVKDTDIDKYTGAYLLKPNLNELSRMTGMPVKDDTQIVAASETLRKACKCEYVLTTCGAKGMVLVGEMIAPYFIKAKGREVFDVTGAGDTAIAYLAACMANQYDIKEAVYIANCASGLQVSKVGTSSVSWNEVCVDMADGRTDWGYKVIDDRVLSNFRKKHIDKKIVFTNGCFDILHIGHVKYLRQASLLGDILIVGVNSDASVRRLKGQHRPVNPEEDRTEILCSLDFVDYVVIFEDDTPYRLINILQPDVLVKGGDYRPDEIVGKEIVENRGGKLVLIPYVDGKSTTGLIEKIRN